MIHTGEATNVVPDHCEMQGTVRTFTLEVLDLIENRMKQITENLCAAFDAKPEFHFNRNYPPTVNSAAEANFARSVMEGIVGKDNVQVQEPTMGAEDFSFMLQTKPGAYLRIGQGSGSSGSGPRCRSRAACGSSSPCDGPRGRCRPCWRFAGG